MDHIKKSKQSNNLNEVKKYEPVSKIVEKADENFLIDLKIRMINQEISKLKNLELQNTEAVKKQEKLKQTQYEKFKEDYDKQKKIIGKVYRESAQLELRKQEILKEIKNKSMIQSTLKYETKKLEETALYYSELRDFIDQICPKQIKEKMQMQELSVY